MSFFRHCSFILFFCYYCTATAFPQNLSYINYNTKDGLAGSTVYDMCQDPDGFMWFATENGLSRFDGTHFQNFTVQDGLPDNEVLKVFADSRNRVWIGTFSKQICYYYNGQIHNSSNDSLVRKIGLTNSIATINETTSGDVMICDQYKLIEVSATDKVTELSALPIFRSRRSTTLIAFPNFFDGGYFIVTADSVFKYRDDRLTFSYLVPKNIDRTYFEGTLFSDGTRIKLRSPSPIIGSQGNYKKYTVQYIGTIDGAWEIDTITYAFKQHFLKGKKISRVMEDSEKNVWFSSMGEGVFKLPSKGINTIIFDKTNASNNTEVYSLAYDNDRILAGLGFSKIALVDPEKVRDSIATSNERIFSQGNYNNNRLYCSKVLSSGISLLGFDHFLVKMDGGDITLGKDIFPVKSIDEINNEYALVGTSRFAIKIRVKDLAIVDTIWNERCTKVFYCNGFYYIGTLNGLFKIDEVSKAHSYLGDLHPSLKRRINDIKVTKDNTLWIATNDEGLIVLRDNKVLRVINENNGLSSNICKTLFADEENLWVGTNKGLNKLSIAGNDSSITRYSSSDGLPSDIINSIYKLDSVVWVGSPAGLSHFVEKDISRFSICELRLVNVNISGNDVMMKDSYALSYGNNNINFEYAGISFKSGGDITYRYMLKGLDKDWKETKQNSLNYQSLHPGEYELHLQAVNKFGIKSNLLIIPVLVKTPFWRTVWFIGSVIILFILLIGWLIMNRNRKFRSSLEEKSRTEQQFAALEQQALQAQMNPHFIFNCLNSIQQYILTNDKEAANKYLTGFASLVRQTLDNSEKRTITIAEEVQYLKKYLEMEKMRSGNGFEYTIHVDGQIKPDYVQIPALLLQPYVENSLRHGIRYMNNISGKIEIMFFLQNDTIHCHIKDNGIGRKRSAELKSAQHIEYQSKGMSLTEKRVALLNKNSQYKINIEIVDMTDTDGNATGTEIIVKIPAGYESKN